MNQRRPDSPAKAGEPIAALRDRILDTASSLFYREGVHAVGVDLVVKKSGIAKTSLYRHFGSKDALIAAFLEREDADFWRQWGAIADRHQDDPEAELAAYLEWMAERLRRPGYCGCPQLNVAAELRDPDHPARRIAQAHKDKMRGHLSVLAKRLDLKRPDAVGAQLALAFDGAFISAPFGHTELLVATLNGTVQLIVEPGQR
ncbi:MAG: TetR/AcrR family transcriptional regulator [Sphingomonas sp.]|uniref:TetR/AcrR family transcriptional regulator n=1 Tax=Sphingomonas sp. TaxID=28214 RepID=UPI001792D58F|nr:TetR/AcrR family transcriptional regulator [Sphingomonas sp.]MBA3666683.1 TetR/AcrR family transcriptional regulator [Sphingomonas sp.]